MPKALFTTLIMALLPIAKTIKTVPIIHAIIAFLAVSILDPPPAVRYKIPATIQPTTTNGVPMVMAAVSTAIAIDVNVWAEAATGNNKTTPNKIKNKFFLFTPQFSKFIF